MAFPITVTDVENMCPAASSVDETVVQMYIDLVDQVDACLDSSNAPDSIQKFLKTSAVCHYICRSQGGTVKSETDMDGASVTFETYKVDGYGLSSTSFGQNILSSGYQSCFAFMDASPSRFITAVGR
jgi:hypothetical protein